MTLNVPSFFAGIGTVVVLLTLGFGGGVMMSGVISDKPREPAKVEKWAAEARKSPAAETEKPPVVTATPVPVAPAPAPAPVTPTPVAAASSAQPVAKEEPAPQAAAQPVSQLQPAQVSTVSPPSPAPSDAAPTPPKASPALQERPVALTNPAPPAPLARERLQKAKREAAEKRKAQERKQAADRRRQRIDNAETRVTERRPQREIDDDDDDRAPLPFFRGREREDFRPRPLFRLFGDQD